MIDSEFVQRVKELNDMGKEGMPQLREMLKNGNLTRLISLAALGVGVAARVNKNAVKVKTRIPDDFPGEEEKQKAVVYWESKRRPDLVARAEEEAEKFAAHHLSKGTRSESWAASWRTWYSQALEFNKPPRNGDLFVAGPIFEQTSPAGWAGRLDGFYRDGTWLPKWAAKPPASPSDPIPPDCKCPRQAFTLYQQNQRRMG